MRILKNLIVLLFIFSIIYNPINCKTIKSNENVDDDASSSALPLASDTNKPTIATKPPITTPQPTTDPDLAGASKAAGPPNHATVAPNDVPTFKPTNTKAPEYQPLTSLPPTQPPPKSAAPTTTMPPKGQYQPPPQVPNSVIPKTQAPVVTNPPVEETEAPQTQKPSATKKPSSTSTPATTEPVEETESPSANSDISSFSLETDKPTQTPKPPKTTPPTNLIPTFSESSYDYSGFNSKSESSDSSKLNFNNLFLFTILLLNVFNFLI